MKKPLSKCKLLKYLEKTYPVDIERIHLRAVRDLDNAIDYCKKEDSECVTLGCLPCKNKMTKEIRKIESDMICNGFLPPNHKDMNEKELQEWYNVPHTFFP